MSFVGGGFNKTFMKLSIIILNYKSKGLVKQCLKQIKLANFNFDYEIIVVDNNSKDGIKELIQQNFSEIKFIGLKQNLGYAAGNNAGIKQSQAENILILNPDILIDSGQVEKMIDYLENNSDVGLIAPKLLNPNKTVQNSCYLFPKFHIPILRRTPLGKIKYFKKQLDEYLMKDWDHSSNKQVDWVLGAALMFRKKDLEKVGLLDERFVLYFEDIDWCRRFWKKELKVVYFADAEMIHYHGRASAQGSWIGSLFNKTTRIHIQSWIKYFIKHGLSRNDKF